MDVGILAGDFQLQGGLGRRVIGQGRQDVGAAQQRLAPHFAGGQAGGGGGVLWKIHGQFHALQRADRNADGLRQARAGLGPFALGVGEFKLGFLEGDAKSHHLRPGHRAGLDLLIQSRDDLLLDGNPALQERLALPRRRIIEQAGAHPGADMPGRGREVQARGFGQLPGLGDAMAPLAGRFQWHIETDGGEPGTQPGCGVDVAEVEGGRDAHGGIGPSAGGLDGGLRHSPLCARDFQISMIIKGREGQPFKIPGARRPGGGIAGEILFEESRQAGIVEGAVFQGGGGPGGRQRPRLVVSAANGQSAQKQSRAKSGYRSQQLQELRAFAARTPAL